MQNLQAVSQIILNSTSILLINLTTLMLFVQRALPKIPLGFFLIYFPSSTLAFLAFVYYLQIIWHMYF